MKLTNRVDILKGSVSTYKKRIYLDYNATSPLSKNVLELLKDGDFLFANASSQHQRGKKVLKKMNEIKKFIHHFFKLNEQQFKIFFHSGATEGMNTLFNLNRGDAFIYFKSDHASIHAIGRSLRDRGVSVCELPIKKDGHFDLDFCLLEIEKKSKAKNIWLNYNFMNSETGVVWSLEKAITIKKKLDIKIHVDAVQSVGKVLDFESLSPLLDAYTYSGHKFGALKGVGFTFYKKEIPLRALLLGGGQQEGVRGGTVNSHGIQTIAAALEEVQEQRAFEEIKLLKNKLISIFSAHANIKVIPNESSNTICFVHENLRSDAVLIHFDLAGLDVSSGSACSSGTLEPSLTLQAMGFLEKSKNNIRLSLGACNLEDEEEILERCRLILKKI